MGLKGVRRGPPLIWEAGGSRLEWGGPTVDWEFRAWGGVLDLKGVQSLAFGLDRELGIRGLRVWAAVPAQEWGSQLGQGVPTLGGSRARVDRGAGDCTLRGGPGRALTQHPVPLVPSAGGGPPTCRLSAHGCGGGGGGGGSSGLRKTCWPRLRNWTTAMRMWCSTRTMLAAARPPAGPAAALGQRVRGSFAGSELVSAPAPPRPAHSPPPTASAPPTAPPRWTAPLGWSAFRTSPRALCWLPPPVPLRSQDSSSSSRSYDPPPDSQLPASARSSCPFPSCRYLAWVSSRSPSPVCSHPLPPPLRKSSSQARAPKQRPAQ